MLSLYFWSNNKVRGNIHYGAFLLTLSASIWIGYLYDTGEIFHFPALARVGFPLTALSGSFFYLGVRGQLIENYRSQLWHKADWFYFIIPGGIIIYLLPFYLSSNENKLQYLREDLEWIHTDCTIINYLTLSYVAFSTIRVFLLLARVRRMDLAFSQEQKRELMRQSIYTALLFIVPAYWSVASVINANAINTGTVSALTALIVLVMSIDRIYYHRSGAMERDIPAPSYNKSLLSEKRVEGIIIAFNRIIDEEKIFTDPELHLDKAAQKIGVSRNHLSQSINRKYGKKFSEIINEYRAREAARLMQDPEYSETTFLRIALDSGFNAKSTFNSAFKKVFGQSPSDYRHSL